MEEDEAVKKALDRHANVNQYEEDEDSKSGLNNRAEVGASDNDSVGLTEEERLLFEMIEEEEKEDKEEEKQLHEEMNKEKEDMKHSKSDKSIEIYQIMCQNKLLLHHLEKVEYQIIDNNKDISVLQENTKSKEKKYLEKQEEYKKKLCKVEIALKAKTSQLVKQLQRNSGVVEG